jgi:hypothetical protein
LENVTALLLTNSALENITVDTFMDSQQILNNPMVIFYDKETNEVIKTFHIAADTMEKLTEMFKYKYFDTTDLLEDNYIKFGGAYFIGAGKKEVKAC